MNTAESKQGGGANKKPNKKRSITGPLIKLDPIKVQNIVSKKKSLHAGQTQRKHMQFGSQSSIDHTSSMHIMPEFAKDTKASVRFRMPKGRFRMNGKLPLQNPQSLKLIDGDQDLGEYTVQSFYQRQKGTVTDKNQSTAYAWDSPTINRHKSVTNEGFSGKKYSNLSEKSFQDLMALRTPLTVKTPYLSKYEGFVKKQKKISQREEQMRKSSQTNLTRYLHATKQFSFLLRHVCQFYRQMKEVNQIDNHRRSLTSLAQFEDYVLKEQRNSSTSIMEVGSQTTFQTNDQNSFNKTNRIEFKELLKLNRQLKVLQAVAAGNKEAGSSIIEGFNQTDGFETIGERPMLLPVTSPYKKGKMSSIMRRNLKINQQASTERSVVQEPKTPATLRMNDSDYRDN